MTPSSIRRLHRPLALLIVGTAIGCGLPRKQDVDLAQSVFELSTVLQELRQNQQDLQDRLDSLGALVGRQDSTIRSLANLLGAPLPAR